VRLDEFKDCLRQYQSAVNRNLIYYLLPAVLLSVLLLIPSWGLFYKITSLSPGDTELILRAVSGIGGMVVFVALMIAFILKTGRLRKRHGLLCPECGKPLMGFIV